MTTSQPQPLHWFARTAGPVRGPLNSELHSLPVQGSQQPSLRHHRWREPFPVHNIRQQCQGQQRALSDQQLTLHWTGCCLVQRSEMHQSRKHPGVPVRRCQRGSRSGHALLLLLITCSYAQAAQQHSTAAANLLPENQKILAKLSSSTPPAPPGGLDHRGGSSCQANDSKCYDHTHNIGYGNVTVSSRFPPSQHSPYNYAELLHKSYIFYYQQRSGKLPSQVGVWCCTLTALLRRNASALRDLPVCICSTKAHPHLPLLHGGRCLCQTDTFLCGLPGF